jgi:hypothetical protein
MKILSSNIAMTSESHASQSMEKSESMNYWTSDEGNSDTEITIIDIVDISTRAQAAYSENMSVGKAEKDETVFEISEADKIKIYLLEAFMERLTGKKFTFKFYAKISIKNGGSKGAKSKQAAPADDGRVGWGFQYDYHEIYKEQEHMSFSAEGIIKTQDGKEINVALELNMSRRFISENHLQVKAGDALIDPIVINFAGPAASLTQDKFVFDLDSDGVGDRISFVGPGSGLLALDKNGDGVINNGTELFGPNTQDGFGELSEYDLDGNGWIDENDPIFDNLRIWVKDENGNDQLFALGQKGVGAIYLGAISTEYSMKDTNNNLLGQMRSSSIFVSEDGDVGIVHQIDLAVQ